MSAVPLVLPEVRGSAPTTPRDLQNDVYDEDGDILDQPNPFVLPTDDIFQLRELERQRKLTAKERLKNQKIWEKDVKRRRPNNQYARRLLAKKNANLKKQDKIFHAQRREKENMADFIAKKRDMFLIQMSLDTKRQEIQKLEEKAQMKEDALKKSEMMLEEDAMRFDAFLKENDRKAHEALRKADAEAKEKAERVADLKKLNQEISRIKNDMSKQEESLAQSLNYKLFLDSLTPPEWLEDRRKKAAAAANAEMVKNEEGEYVPAAGQEAEDDHMYFKDPVQLLDIFAHLEERNLFLIQNVQETEEALEELKTQFAEGKQEMEGKTKQVEANIAELAKKLRQEDGKAANLAKRAAVNTLNADHRALARGLSNKIAVVYEDCGFDPETQTDSLEMLRELERWLEFLLNAIEDYKKLDPTRVAEEEKVIKDIRRHEWRKAVKLEVQRQAEERKAKSTARAKAEIVRRSGKQVMFRSPPVVKKVRKEKKQEINPEAEELVRYLT